MLVGVLRHMSSYHYYILQTISFLQLGLHFQHGRNNDLHIQKKKLVSPQR